MNVFRFRSGISHQVRRVWQALAVDLPRNRLHGKLFDEKDPGRNRRLWKLLGQGRRHVGNPLRRRGATAEIISSPTEGAATKATSAPFW